MIVTLMIFYLKIKHFYF